MTTPTIDRESIANIPNPIGMIGIEFIEYAISKPHALGQVLEMMGFQPIARHRSREVLLYRQGGVNIIVNAHHAGLPHSVSPDEQPTIAAVALRVHEASAAYQRAIALGAWAVPTHVEVIELNIPTIHGVGSSCIYFVDRFEKFFIYDVDFVPIPGVDQHPAATAGLHCFGLVKYIGNERSADWIAFYNSLLGFDVLPDTQRFGILPKGTLMQSPCRSFYLQLIETEPTVLGFEENEYFHRLGLGTSNVMQAVQALSQQGVEFVESPQLHAQAKGALTQTWMGSVSF
ncbi:MAG: 4-hydroxyphenylpyruvate dioxygenase [Limnohabitans sp.]|nr:4-hydroxyphenylpyruvate dioxygenase [Limnohabitans sp.]